MNTVMSGEYQISDNLYSHSPSYEENFVPADSYSVTTDFHLYEKRNDGIWTSLGAMEAYPLTNDELYFYNLEGWHRHYPIKKITDAYILRVENDFFYLVFQTKDGNCYLAYGWEDIGERGQAGSDDTGLRRLYILLTNIEGITFEQAWKTSGLSSNMDDYFDPADAVFIGIR